MATRRISRLARRLDPLSPASQKPVVRPPITATPSSRRTLFTVPKIARFQDADYRGVSLTSDPKKVLYSPNGFSVAWTRWQSYLVTGLNYIASDDPEIQTMHPQTVAQRYQRDPQYSALFNYASLAHNNHFYFSGISANPRPLSNYEGLRYQLERDFNGLDALRNGLLQSSAGVFGPGFVWLVWVRGALGSGEGRWSILATYTAGTPYAQHQRNDDGTLSRGRIQNRDLTAMTPDQAVAYQRPLSTSPKADARAGYFGQHSAFGRNETKRKLGAPSEHFPCLCVNLWPHAWLTDFGPDGKQRFLETWWNFIDWGQVEYLAPVAAKRPPKPGYLEQSYR